MKCTLLAGLGLAVSSLITAGPVLGANECQRSAHQMRAACGADTSDDYFVAQAICLNESDAEELTECAVVDARAEFQENLAECRDQLMARLDLCDALADDGPYDPDYEPGDFLSPDEIQDNPNPYFPLIFGNTWVYEAEDETIVVTVLEETTEIDGVEVISVQDVVMENDEVIEDTIDWYAQDRDGNVWYFGEIAKNFEDGFLTDIDGSFRAGEGGAKPGIIMFADPTPGTAYRQEFALGEAEDAGEVLNTAADEEVEAGSCDGTCVVVRDFSPLEPDANEEKYFAPGVGLILEIDLVGGDRVELVEFLPGG